ncbi:restriction endonuclease subunit S [[Clostridium] aminophilum]|uniref:Type I restriction enzyme, S subunit n=1 Tax=[Clostridium] aminophilum TaxID=1526 RepID=A0A1I6JUH0_9FIRM|nr:restriction endonuclease subunit S [[Clostridium] aminophilum]SFR82655.1 type I restriction enzyme, S subunit [[Clostridium] aminophilum]
MEYRLGQICKFQSGGTPAKGNSEYFNGNIPWITTTALNGSEINDHDAVDWITEKAINESAAKIVPANSIMVGTRVGVGKVAINKVPMSTSQDIISLLDIAEDKWDKDYLCKLIQANYAFLNSQARGATIKGIKIDVLAALKVPEIPLEKQRKVSDVINKTRGIIDQRRKELERLDELIKARFVELFGYHADNNMTLEECCSNITGGGTPSMQHPEFYGGNIPFIKSGDVKGTQVTEGALWLTEEALNRGKTKLIPKGSIVVVVRSAALLHKFSIAVSANDLVINQDLKALTPSKDFLPEFLMWSIKSQEQILLGKVQTMLTSHIRIEDLLGLKVHKASMGEQIAFVDFLRQVDKSKVAVQKSLEETQKLFDSLMQEYFG